MQGSPRRVVFLGDFLRPLNYAFDGGVDGAVNWLANLFENQILHTTGLPVERVLQKGKRGLELELLFSKGGTGHDDRMTFWAANHFSLEEEVQKTVLPSLKEAVSESICIGFELSPWQRMFLRELGVPFLEVWNHPVRFGLDLFFAVSASDAGLLEGVSDYMVAETVIMEVAGYRRATCGNMQTPLITKPGTLLVLGQSPHDRSQISADGFFRIQPEDDGVIQKLLSSYEECIVKPHPYCSDHPLTSYVKSHLEGVIESTQNVYQLLSSPDIECVLTVNSSAAFEATYFGKKVVNLRPPAISPRYRGEAGQVDDFYTFDSNMLATDFWACLLSPFSRSSAGSTPAFPSPDYTSHRSLLRRSLNIFWNINEVDSDLEVQACLNAKLRPSQPEDARLALDGSDRQTAKRPTEIRRNRVASYEFAKEHLQKLLKRQGRRKIVGLEMFCGDGYGTRYLSKSMDCIVHGIDASREAIADADRHFSGKKTLYAVKKYPFALSPNRYDFIVSYESVEHVEAGGHFLRSLRDALLPGGILILSTPDHERFPSKADDHPLPIKHFTVGEMEDQFRGLGLEILCHAGQNIYQSAVTGKGDLLLDEEMVTFQQGAGQVNFWVTRKRRSLFQRLFLR